MQIEPIEIPLILPMRNAQTADLAALGYSANDERESTEERVRLMLSWRAVLGEIGFSERGAGQ
jgi:hypothetical protein